MPRLFKIITLVLVCITFFECQKEKEPIIPNDPDLNNPDLNNPDLNNPDLNNPDLNNPDLNNPETIYLPANMTSETKRFLEFIQGKEKSSKADGGYSFNDILNFDDNKLEQVHSFIQYIFPLPEKSPYSKNEPLIKIEDISKAAKKNPKLIYSNLKKAFILMMNHWGFKISYINEKTNNSIKDPFFNENKYLTIIKETDRDSKKFRGASLLDGHDGLRFSRMLQYIAYCNLPDFSEFIYNQVITQYKVPFGFDDKYFKGAIEKIKQINPDLR